MASTEFQSGPFTFFPRRQLNLAGTPCTLWELNYSHAYIGERTAPAAATQTQVRELFESDIERFAREMESEHAPTVVHLIDFDSGESVASVTVVGDLGLTPGVIDDRSKFWLQSSDRRRSRDIFLADFSAIIAKHQAPARSWICGLLPDEVLADDPTEWRSPTSWELRHVVGEGSLTGVSGAKAAALVGVTPQNFRKYTAADGASTRQNISFAMWHLLLHRLEIQSLRG